MIFCPTGYYRCLNQYPHVSITACTQLYHKFEYNFCLFTYLQLKQWQVFCCALVNSIPFYVLNQRETVQLEQTDEGSMLKKIAQKRLRKRQWQRSQISLKFFCDSLTLGLTFCLKLVYLMPSIKSTFPKNLFQHSLFNF